MPQVQRRITSNSVGLQQYNTKKKCPKCLQKCFAVLETRTCDDGVRRRYRCESCGFRESRYEVSSAAYEELRELRRIVGGMRGLLGKVGSESSISPRETIPCQKCDFFNQSECSFGVPEAGTADAAGCNYFRSVNSSA